jgi:predicted dehydrogenase
VAVSDLRADRRKYLQDVYQCDRPYESLEKLILDPEVEAVAVFTGAPDHVRHVVDCMNHGKHVCCAVPAATSLEEAHLLKETKERTGLKYMMAETSYYRAECILARQIYQDGKFGRFLYSEVEYYHPMVGAERDALWFWNGQHTWRFGYPPMLYPTHSTAFHVGVTRERFTKVSCLGAEWYDEDSKHNPYNNPFMNQVALCQGSRGNISRVNVLWGVHAGGERAQWIGETGALYMASGGGQPFIGQFAGQPDLTTCSDYFYLLPEPLRIPSGHGNSHTFITHEFVSALLEEREPAVSVYEALAITVPGIVAMESCRRGGEQLSIPSFDRA